MARETISAETVEPGQKAARFANIQAYEEYRAYWEAQAYGQQTRREKGV